VLVPTLVPGVNTHEVGAIVDFALKRVPTVRGVHFQPVSYFGRYMAPPKDGDRLTLPELMRALEDQTHGKVKASDFKPPGCENSLCSFHGHYLAQQDGRLMPLLPAFEASPCCGEPIRADIGAQNATAYVARQWSGADSEIPSKRESTPCCPSASEKPAAYGIMSLDAFLHQARTRTFSISAMAFQDVWNLTLDRVQDCCIHVMAPDGRLVPFCLYNLTAANGAKLYRP
jgi:7,8-dihydro-6-hydroxymethylpterin dimethyltransferase